MVKKDKNAQDKQPQRETSRAGDSCIGLAVGLSLGTLVGILMEDIGLGMMLGVAMGLCVGPAMGSLGKNKKAEVQKDSEKH